VGVLFNYFSAASDEAAASAIELPGGSGVPARPSAHGLAEVPGRTPEQAPFDTVFTKAEPARRARDRDEHMYCWVCV